MPRRPAFLTVDSAPDAAAGTMQLNCRIRPEQDMVLTVIARVRSTDKSSLVTAAIDTYINSLPKDFIAALVAMEQSVRTLDGQPTPETAAE